MDSVDAVVTEGLERAAALRRAIEARIEPRASSVDGRAFELVAQPDAPIGAGDYVTLETEAGARIGLVLAVRHEMRPAASIGLPSAGDSSIEAGIAPRLRAGSGVLLDPGVGFTGAPVAPAPAAAVADLLAAGVSRTPLDVGELARVPGVAAILDPLGFGRHTFLCGQSGSGKTYSLGVLLERLLLRTRLPIVILDPNSDHVRLADTRAADPGPWAAVAEGIRVRRYGADGDERLRVRLGQLDPATQAALLRLDPITEREEYAAYLDALERHAATDRKLSAAELLDGDDPGVRALRLRFGNLGIGAWQIWARSTPGPTLLDELGGRAFRALCVDLGTVPSPDERAVVATAVVERLWEDRSQRRPVLVVIDEAHNVCPAQPVDPLTARATETVVRIAAEGRKYGIYLLVSTQRPEKVHPEVLAQCDSLVCMRMNSPGAAADLARSFGFAPASLLEQAPAFGLGEALVAGRLAPHPLLVRFGERLTEEGGADVPADWL